MTSKDARPRAPVTDAIIVAIARLVDDAQTETREPSHSDIEFQLNRAGLSAGDPKAQGQVVGKAKRVRAVLSWALEHAPDQAEVFVATFLALLRGKVGSELALATSLVRMRSSTPWKHFEVRGLYSRRKENFDLRASILLRAPS